MTIQNEIIYVTKAKIEKASRILAEIAAGSPYCGCGCGRQTTWAKKYHKWNKFVRGHNSLGLVRPRPTTDKGRWCHRCGEYVLEAEWQMKGEVARCPIHNIKLRTRLGNRLKRYALHGDKDSMPR